MIRSSLKIGMIILATMAAFLGVGLGSADAAPNGCSKYGGGTYSIAKCTGGTGSYQAYAVCKQPQWPYFSALREGPWQPARSNKESWVWCPPLYLVQSRGVGLRN